MRKTHVREVIGSYDILMFLIVVLLCSFGIIMIYSTSYYNAELYYSSSEKYFSKQIINVVIGLFIMILVSMFDYHAYTKKFFKNRLMLLYFLYLACLGLQLFVVIDGYSANGSSRWIQIGTLVSFQPTELTKICFILVTAYLSTRFCKEIKTFKGFLPLVIILGPLAVLVGVNDLSSAIVLIGIMLIGSFVVSSIRPYHFAVLGVGIVGMIAMVFMYGYRSQRIDVWLHPELQDKSSQIIQGLYAIASGGFFGKGLGEGVQKLAKIQEVHTDMIFTVICEELGLFGACIVIAMFLMLLWRIYVIAKNARDMFGSVICAGVFAHIALQLLINLAVVTNSIPATGIPLPFISYGGTSLVVLLAEMGLVLNVSKQIPGEGARNG